MREKILTIKQTINYLLDEDGPEGLQDRHPFLYGLLVIFKVKFNFPNYRHMGPIGKNAAIQTAASYLEEPK